MNYHELLARLGVSGAHPGGFEETAKILKRFPPAVGSRVLEIGCGTGQTACHLARLGCDVTALDVQPAMLRRAEQRAAAEGVHVAFVQGDACALPFPEGSFDLVFVESVTSFIPIKKALSNYFRVLKKGGRLLDREMVLKHPADRTKLKPIVSFYRIGQLLTGSGWITALCSSGFRSARVLELHAMPKPRMLQVNPSESLDWSILGEPDVQSMLAENDRLMERYRNLLGYAVFQGTK